MRISKMGGVIVAGAVLALPAAGIAAKSVSPKNGSFKGTPKYKVSGKSESAKLTITVAKHKISAVELIATVAPQDKKHSHGIACGVANDFPTTGYKRSGTISASGQYSYTFSTKSSGFNDKITVVGHFTDATHAVGTWHDVFDGSASHSHCDTGKLHFSVSHV